MAFSCFIPWAALLASLTVDWYLSRSPSPEFQAFIDHYPVTKCDLSLLYFLRFGPSPATRLPPKLLDRFDWILDQFDGAHKIPTQYSIFRAVSLGTPDRLATADPGAVFATAFALQRVLSLLERHADTSHNDRVLVLGGSDQRLSDALGHNASERARTLRRLRQHFRAIFFEAKDVDIDGVRVMPRGLSEHYLRTVPIGNAVSAIASADTAAKPRRALVAFDYFSSFVSQPEWWDRLVIRDASLVAKISRYEALWYADSPHAREAGVEARSINSKEWWGELAKYQFLIAPLGSGVVPPKLVEALLVLTVPIIQRAETVAFDDLVRFGFPLVIVESWTEVSSAKLHDWWAELAPRLKSFRRHCLTTDSFWRLFTGQVAICS